MNEKKNVEIRKPCMKCEGTGFLKYETKICETCNGIKCIMCNSTGYEKMPWDLCDKCYGDGYFIVSHTSNQ
jgi:DnaJ-class molecular chaperone